MSWLQTGPELSAAVILYHAHRGWDHGFRKESQVSHLKCAILPLSPVEGLSASTAAGLGPFAPLPVPLLFAQYTTMECGVERDSGENANLLQC